MRNWTSLWETHILANMRKELELVCRSLGILSLCIGALLGVDVVSRLWGPTIEFPMWPSTPDAGGAVQEPLKRFYEALQPTMSTRIQHMIPQLIARGIVPIVLGLYLMRTQLLIDLCCGPEHAGQPQDKSTALKPQTGPREGGTGSTPILRKPDVAADVRFAPPNYSK